MAKAKEDRDIFSISNILRILTTYWYWFVLSLVVCLGLAHAYIKIKSPVYTRNAQVLIKENDNGSVNADIGSFTGFDFLNKSSNLWDELQIIKSADIMAEVVSKLQLNKNFILKDGLKKKSLYADSIPVDVNLAALDPNVDISFTIKIKDKESFELSNFKREGVSVGDGATVRGKFDQMLRTPIGKIGLIKTPGFSSLELPATIKFLYSDVYNTALGYCEKIKVDVLSTKANVIEITVNDVNTRRGDDIIKEMIESYNHHWIEDKNLIANSTSKFIDERLAVIESDLTNVDTDISSFKSSNLLPDLVQASGMYLEQASKANAKILELNNLYHMAKYVKSYIDNKDIYQLLPVNSGFEDQTLAQQISTYNSKIIERNNLASVSSPSNPVVKDMDAALNNMRESIRAALQNQIVSLEEQIRSQQRYEGEAVEKIASNPKQAKYLLSVERQQKVKESLYIYLLQKREENELSQSFAAYNTRVIQQPNGPKKPTSPKSMIIYLVAFVLGLVIPYTIIALRMLTIKVVQNRSELDSLKMPRLAEIPTYVVHKKRAFLSKFIPGLKKDKAEEARVVVSKGNRNVVNEAFRIARTNMEMMLGSNTGKNVVMTTSFNPGSGKSFITMNLAMVCAFKDKRVAVVDCDLRHGSISEYVDNPRIGLSEYLSGTVNDRSQIEYTYPGMDNLIVVPIGKVPPNPTELLATDRMVDIVKDLRDEFDYVFLDCPPYDLVADTQILAGTADLTMFVVRMGLLERDMIDDLEKLYKDKAFNHMTLVINGIDVAKSRYHQYGKGSDYYASTK